MSKLNFKYILQHYYKIFFSAVIFIIYTFTLAPSVQQIDAGELAAVQCTLGIAHPTGYPLFTLIGFLFQLIPMPLEAIVKLNLLSAIWSAVSIYFFLATLELVFQKIYVKIYLSSPIRKKSRFRKAHSSAAGIFDQQYIEILSVTGAGFILAFSKTFWLQSTGVEVYSLHMALISLIVFFLIRTLYDHNKTTAEMTISWMWISMAIALGFTNHMTTVMIIPAAALLFLSIERLNLTSLRILGVSLLVFIAVIILFYWYLPTRASMNPALNWGNPENFSNIFRHITGQQYSVWMFVSVEAAEQKLVYFYENLRTEFFIVILPIAVLGFVEFFIRSKILFFFILVCLLTSVLYAINYDINDIDAYFLLAYYSLSFISFFGIVAWFKILRYFSLPRPITTLVISAAIISHVVWNYTEVDQSDVYTFEDYTKTILNNVEENAIIFNYQWDYFLSASYYYQLVENYRSDVIVIGKELLRRSWYYEQLRNSHRNLFDGFKGDVNNFLAAVAPFESGDEYNSELIEKNYRQVLTNLIAYNIDEHSYYLGPELIDNEIRNGQLVLPKGYRVVPHLLLFKVVKGKKYVPAPDPNFKIRIPDNTNRYTDFIEKITARMLSERAMYELSYKKYDRAKVYAKKVSTDFPNFPLPDQLNKILN